MFSYYLFNLTVQNKSLLGDFLESLGRNHSWDLYDIVKFLNFAAHFLLGFAGIIAVIYLILGGYTYLISSGNPEQIARGKSMIFWSLGGLLLIVSAWVLVKFVLDTLGVAEPSIP